MQVKGSALRARVDWVKDRGEQAYGDWLQSLSDRARQACEAGFLPTEWYPFEVFVELCESIDHTFGEGDLSLCYDVARYACDKNLPTLYRLFFKVGNVGFVISRAPVVWRVTYDKGEVQVTEREEQSVTLEIRDWPQPRRAHCVSVLGWMTRAAEISGARNVTWDETCRALGDDLCRFSIAWE